jgi:LysM repeat protein
VTPNVRFLPASGYPENNSSIKRAPYSGALAALIDLIAVFRWRERGDIMKRALFLSFILYSLFVASTMLAAAESQTWKVRPGDNLDIIATTLEIPTEEIKKHNPGVLENNLQIGQKLKLPLRSYLESKTLEEELGKKDERIGKLENKSTDLEKKIARAESQLRWHPIWLWGFWTCFSIIAFIASGAYWIFRQTHPRVFEQPHDRSIRDLRESQIRVRSSFPYEEGANIGGGQWHLSLRRFPHAR